jgi:hypothetical protein
MRPYPQYSDLYVIDGERGGDMHYQSVQIKAQKNFSKGYSFLLGYNYHYEKDGRFFNDIDTFAQQYTWQDAGTSRHRLSIAGVWEIPFGKGRPYMTDAPRLLDALVGGWNVSPIVTWRSGRFIFMPAAVVSGDPHISNPGPKGWFDTSVFSPLPAYTPRTNPWYYSGLTGPGMLNVDVSLVKAFHITERFRFELRMDSFNALNGITWSDPDTGIYSSTFGQSTDILANTHGRRTQLGLRVEF